MEGVQNSPSHKVSIQEETSIIITINQPCFTHGAGGGGWDLKWVRTTLLVQGHTGKKLQSDSRAMP